MNQVLQQIAVISVLLFSSVYALSNEITEQARWLLPKEEKYIKISEQCACDHNDKISGFQRVIS
jgi:uncharacterized protein YxeA